MLKFKDYKTCNTVDSDETAHHDPSYLDLVFENPAIVMLADSRVFTRQLILKLATEQV